MPGTGTSGILLDMEQTRELQQQPDNVITRSPQTSSAVDRFQSQPQASEFLKSLPSNTTLQVIGSRSIPASPPRNTQSPNSALLIVVMAISIVCCLGALLYLLVPKSSPMADVAEMHVDPVPEPKKTQKPATKKSPSKKPKKKTKKRR